MKSLAEVDLAGVVAVNELGPSHRGPETLLHLGDVATQDERDLADAETPSRTQVEDLTIFA